MSFGRNDICFADLILDCLEGQDRHWLVEYSSTMVFELSGIPKVENRGRVSLADVETVHQGVAVTIPVIMHLITIDEVDVLVEIFGKNALGLFLAECSALTPVVEKFLGEKEPVSTREDALQAYLAK